MHGAEERIEERPEALVERIRAGAERAGGDRDAETRLVERYARGVRIVLHRHTRGGVRGADLVEDLFQETFRLAVEKLRAGELRDPSKVGAFLAAIAKNLATEHYRKAARRQTEVDSERVEAAYTANEGVVAGSTDESSSPLGEVLQNEEAELVRRTIGELNTERDRQILFRFYIAEEDKDAIAADFELDSLQFNRVLYRARQRYKDLYLERARVLGLASTVAVVLALCSWRGATFLALAPLES